eukprot:scaffold64606_cov59-Phaeocystis_antarctica.AAC.3
MHIHVTCLPWHHRSPPPWSTSASSNPNPNPNPNPNQVTTALVDFLILPVWILWLAAQLRNLSAMGAYASSVEMAPALAVAKSAEADANVV